MELATHKDTEMNWKIGDRAIYDCLGSRAHGLRVVIISEYQEIKCRGVKKMGYVFDPKIAPGSAYTHWCNSPKHFKPIPDEYDGLQVTTWDECVWQPKVMV